MLVMHISLDDDIGRRRPCRTHFRPNCGPHRFRPPNRKPTCSCPASKPFCHRSAQGPPRPSGSAGCRTISSSALTEIGVFRAVQPRQWGGLELDLATFYEGMVLIASACASTGWVASVVGIHPWQIALFANEAQREVWGDDPDARASSSLAPTGSVRRVDRGFQLAGRWYFSSGVDHCEWALLGGVVPDDGNGAEFRTFLVPRQDFTIDHESWQVTGMAGTGSKDLIVTDAFVPEHRTHRIVDVYHGRDPGFAVNDRPYFRLPWRLVFGYTIAAPAIGAAAGALDAFIEQNRSRVSAYGGPPVAQDPALHRPLARALIAVDAARTRLRSTWTELQSATRVRTDDPV